MDDPACPQAHLHPCGRLALADSRLITTPDGKEQRALAVSLTFLKKSIYYNSNP
jgi:hypothetical protein